MTEAELREAVEIGARILEQCGLAEGGGHVSARIPGTERFVAARCRTFDDLDETVLDAAIYRAAPATMAVVHTHQPVATLFADIEKPIRALGGAGANICFLPSAVYSSARPIVTGEAAREVAALFGAAECVYLRDHGIVFAADCLEEAVIRPIWLEQHARMTLQAATFGAPVGLDAEEAAIKAQQRFGVEARWRYYASLVKREASTSSPRASVGRRP